MPGGLRAGVLRAQHAEHPAQFGQRLDGAATDARQALLQLVGGILGQVHGDLRLHRDHRHVVGDHVVQLAGDPAALLQQGAPGPLVGVELLLGDQFVAGLLAAVQCGAERGGDELEDHHRLAVARLGQQADEDVHQEAGREHFDRHAQSDLQGQQEQQDGLRDQQHGGECHRPGGAARQQ